MSPRPAQVFSYGGGKQSIAMAVLISQGKLPIPDYMVIADTGREASTTWAYLEEHIQPLLERTVGRTIEVASHDLATVDLYAKNGQVLIPAFTRRGKRKDHGPLPVYCSNEWKQRVIMRWLRQQGVDQCDIWLGFTIDELERVKPMKEKWIQRVYPLIDWLPLARQDAVEVVLAAGLPEPPRSACWMCPLRSDQEWVELVRDAPEDFAQAIGLEQEIRERDPDVFLHRSAVPIDQVEFRARPGEAAGQCSLGLCMV